ncbi:MAG: UDP-2,3-diacylglucosamine pyrophosphatase [Rickettsiales bacterium]|nr:UDP-2,3-diacylglucosamine pyrophosphatase [Rickettsiales bacterium]
MAQQKIKTAIIAGGGSLPKRLVQACLEQDREPFVIGFKGQDVQAQIDFEVGIASAGKIIKKMHQENVQDVIFVGSIKRPSFSELKPDLRGAKLIAKIGLKSLGDDALLKFITKELEQEGFRVLGVHEVLEEILVPKGNLTKAKPDEQAQADIERGLEVASAIGALDVGQSVVVQQGLVIGVEAIEGTDSLLNRSGTLMKKGAGGVLVKLKKPQQDERLDLPTIGVQTVQNAIQSNVRGIAVKANETIVVDLDEMIELANKNNLFIVGL